ncbi:MAG: ATP-binding cassette domain-containing protein [Flaviflexus sp.]|nr:ATP-binding cassette domain-containing protein [Flaviflexus sp.]
MEAVVISPAGRRDTWIVAALRCLYAVGMGAVLVTAAHLLAAIAEGRDFSGATITAGTVGTLVAGLAAFAELRYGGAAARAEEKRIRRRILIRYFAAPPEAGDGEGNSRIVTLMTDNAERVTEYRQAYYGATVAAMAIPFGTLAFVALAIDWVAGLAIMALCPLIPLLVIGFMRFFRSTSAASRRQRATLSAKYLDAIRNLVTIRLLGAGERVEANLREQGERNRFAIMKLLAGNQVVIIVLDSVFSLLLICASAVLAGLRYGTGAVSIGGAHAIVFLSVLLIEPLTQVAGFFYIGMGGKASERAIGTYLAGTQDLREVNRPARPARTDEVADGVTVTDVSYDYGRGPVLTDINLRVRPGERIAIVGRSGGGKTTLVNLLSGVLALQGGEIDIAGRRLADLELDEARQLTALVSQRTWLFTGTIADNLQIAGEAGEDEMWAALERAHVAEEIRRMPNGLHTDVGEQGALISGGQAQRISLARAFLSGRKIIVLDEPTSQVDIESEEKIIAAISAIGRDYTILMVTHRRSLLAIADETWELTGGRLERLEVAQ